jgi:RNA polymerase sigma-70 factor (ECF subfamily)
MPEAVLERVAAGDPAAVGECLTRYQGLIWSLARRHLAIHADAEDAVQDILIDIWRSAGLFDPQLGSETSFVATIARRRLIDWHRKRRGKPDASTPVEELSIAAPEKEDRTEIEDELARVREQMKRLRPEERRVLELSRLQGLSHPRIAEVTDLPLGTVKTHARRGLERLRTLLNVDRGLPAAGAEAQ